MVNTIIFKILYYRFGRKNISKVKILSRYCDYFEVQKNNPKFLKDINCHCY